MEVLGRLVAMLAVVLVGAGLRSTGLLDASRTSRLNDLAYYVALPALVFVSTYDRAIGDLLSLALLVGLVVVVVAMAGLAWVVHRGRASRERRSVAVVQSYHSNLGYLGLPLIAATFDPEVTALASVVLGVGTLVQLPLTVVILATLNGTDAAVGERLRGLATNPVLAALVVGLVVGSTGTPAPAIVADALDVVGSVALPLALLCVGASLDVDGPSLDLGATGAVAALKLGFMPLLAAAVFAALAVDAATFTAAVVMLGMPSAVSTFVFAAELGGDREFASLNVFATTLASVLSLFVLISLIG